MIIMQNSAIGTNNVSGCEGKTLFLCVSYTLLVVPNTKTGSLQLALFYTTLSTYSFPKTTGYHIDIIGMCRFSAMYWYKFRLYMLRGFRDTVVFDSECSSTM